MRILALGVLLGLSVATVSGQGSAPPQRASGPSWELAARIYYPDGRSPAAFDGPDPRAPMAAVERDFQTVGNLCVFGTSSSAREVMYGWHVKVTPVRESGPDLLIRVDWRRTYDKGKPVETPTDSVELTLRPGNGRIPLDYILPDRTQAAACSAVGMALEIRLAR
jgi:hypothetical protein